MLSTPENKRWKAADHQPRAMLGLAFAILNVRKPRPREARESLVTAGICNLCLAASLAEFLSAYPTYATYKTHWRHFTNSVDTGHQGSIFGLLLEAMGTALDMDHWMDQRIRLGNSTPSPSLMEILLCVDRSPSLLPVAYWEAKSSSASYPS
ncbi:MAG: hypothetical protein L6R40_004628 [Gallowayella cf. fulva]|nr:MAG: hypothetical protein L6R40_004628 [Xanthomendoza cf. fulva]